MNHHVAHWRHNEWEGREEGGGHRQQQTPVASRRRLGKTKWYYYAESYFTEVIIDHASPLGDERQKHKALV